MFYVFLIPAAFIAGFIDSISGGGGLIQLPALLLGGLPPQIAMGTNKLIATAGAGAALFNFTRSKKVIWKIVLSGTIFSLVGAYWGAHTLLSLNPSIVAKVIIVILPIAAVINFLPNKYIHEGKTKFSRTDLFVKVPLISSALGFYDGFFGPGSGIFSILALHWILGMNLVHSSATTKILNIISNISALIVFIIAGKILYLFSIPLVAANLLGGYLGSHLTIKKGAGMVKVFLGVSLTILFISLIVKFL